MLRGYRGWKVRNINDEPVLESPSHGSKAGTNRYLWAPGENIAQCSKCSDVPGENCYCGIYSLKSPELDLVSYQPDIIGEVIVWGKIVEGELGYRSSCAMVSLFLLPSVEVLTEEWLDKLSHRYNAQLVKAKGAILDGITKSRRNLLIKRGHLKYVAGMEQFKRDYGWMDKREYSPDPLHKTYFTTE